MKKAVIAGALALGLVAGGYAVTQIPQAQARYSEKKGERWEHRRERRMERLTERLDLTKDQQAKIEAIFEDQGAKMRALREETHRKILGVLTAEQKEKFEKHREKRGK